MREQKVKIREVINFNTSYLVNSVIELCIHIIKLVEHNYRLFRIHTFDSTIPKVTSL